MNYVNIETVSVPGVSVRTSAAYGEVDGQYFPVEAVVPLKGNGYLPVLNIPQMSDVQWQRRCLSERLADPEKYAKIEDVDTAIARLRKWLKEHDPEWQG